MNETKQILKAMELQRNGHFEEAARRFQDLGNKIRDPREKEQFWKQARECRRIRDID